MGVPKVPLCSRNLRRIDRRTCGLGWHSVCLGDVNSHPKMFGSRFKVAESINRAADGILKRTMSSPPPSESTSAHTLAPRDPQWLPTWELVALALGDLIALTIFAAVGRASHDLIATQGAVRATLNTAAPFMLAWLLVGMALGMYRGTALYPLGRVLWRTLLAGAIAGPLGVAIRALWLQRPVIWTFMLVATATSTLALLVWRVAWSRLRRLWWPELP